MLPGETLEEVRRVTEPRLRIHPALARGGELHGAQIREVGLVDEVAGDREWRVDDEEAHARLTQALGSSFTLVVDGQLVRLRGNDADAIGKPVPPALALPGDVGVDDVRGLV